MLQLENIRKEYRTGELTQRALDGVSLSLRASEFVAILGPSGSGKTTLLNVIGGLDRYDSGDLIIDGISTKKYRDRDWDAYRNHAVGFVFQSYNLIPHQSILANVELALTISGVSRKERRRRAAAALEKVGLGNQLHKRPAQLSGGQMQRVAIARALVNDPRILLADEPTGALDSETSVQVMNLLAEVAGDRLVVMVTHNPELAAQYATRTVRLADGRIVDDTNPVTPEEAAEAEKAADGTRLRAREDGSLGRASMSFFTALGLSANNLATKKGRTFLTAFAGSIGIIGIALILSLSNGVNTYITDMQKDTMASYPISIAAQTVDLSDMMQLYQDTASGEVSHGDDAVYANGMGVEMASAMRSSLTENNLTPFKAYLDDPDSPIHAYIGENGILYDYDIPYAIYSYDPAGALVDADTVIPSEERGGMGAMNAMSAMGMGGQSTFSALLPGGADGNGVAETIRKDYECIAGAWPAAWDEVVLVLDKNNEIPLTTMYALGLLPVSDYRDMRAALSAGEKYTAPQVRFSYEELLGRTYSLLPAASRYRKMADGTFAYAADPAACLDDALTLRVVGIIRPAADTETPTLTAGAAYTRALLTVLRERVAESAVVQAQEADPAHNVLSGLAFVPAGDGEKATAAQSYLDGLDEAGCASVVRALVTAQYGDAAAGQFAGKTDAETAAMLPALLGQGDGTAALVQVYDAFLSPGSYVENMTAFGAVDTDAPVAIYLYADTFEDKDGIADCIAAYNENAAAEDHITYTDYVGLLMSSVTTIINVISYVLIAFVGVSLVVSSIMIGIITYISVLERTKEIGILRAIGASRRNISAVFNAETFCIGFFSGIIGILCTLLLLLPVNALIHALADTMSVSAILPPAGAVILILLSVFLTYIGGLIPASAAAKKDPVAALRAE